MKNIFEEYYKPMRNRLAKINLESALAAIWAYSVHRKNGSGLPLELRPPSSLKLNFLQQSQLVALGREVVMHCARVGGEAFTYHTFCSVMNSMSDISNSLSAAALALDEDSVLSSLDALLHQQFPLQKSMDMAQLLRYARIFGDPEINPMVRTKIGFDYGQCFFFLFALMGSLHRTSHVFAAQRYDEFNIPSEACIALFKWISSPVDALALEMKSQHYLDANWASRWNPLATTPLVKHDSRNPDRMYCPVPDLLWQRMGQGMFYDLYSCRGFDKAFGAAFEAHVAEFAEFHLPTSVFTIAREKSFIYEKNTLHGADGMVSDDTGTLVVECKAKRMKIGAKQFDPGSALQEDLKILSDAIVQLYKNIAHIQVPGRTHWVLRNETIYPVVVTLEDWFLFSPLTRRNLELLVKAQLTEAQLSIELVDNMPYTVMSCDEYECMLLAISQTSVATIMADKVKLGYRDWMMKGYLQERHRDVLANVYPGAYDLKFDRFHREMTASWSPAFRRDDQPLSVWIKQ